MYNPRFLYSPWALIIFFLIYGPKFGLFDLSVFVPIFLILLVSFSIYIQKIEFADINFILFIIIFAVSHILFVSAFYGDYEYLIIIRNLRALINTITITVLLQYLYGKGCKYCYKYIIDVILAVLTIGSLAIIIQVLVPSIQPYFALFTGYNKPVYSLRGFGLTSGFDTAGYIAGFAASIYLRRYLISSTINTSILLLINITAVLFTSRTSMGMAILLSVFVVIYNIRFISIVKLIRFVSFALAFVVIFVAPLFFSTFSNNFDNNFVSDIFRDSSLVDLSEFSYSYASTDIQETVDDQLYLPTSALHALLGSGVDADSDVGYVKVLHIGGVVHLISFFLIYFFIPLKILFNSRGVIINSEIRFINYSFMIIMIFSNFKNLYFLSRGYHELFMILLCLLYFEVKYARLRTSAI